MKKVATYAIALAVVLIVVFSIGYVQAGKKTYGPLGYDDFTSGLKEGLVSYYALDETSKQVVDSHGTNDGTNYGAERGVEGKMSNAFEFTKGEDTWVDLFDLSGSEAQTINMWVKVNDYDGPNQIYGTIHDASGGKDGWGVYASSTDFQIMVGKIIITFFIFRLQTSRRDKILGI